MQLFDAIILALRTDGEAQEKSLKEVTEKLIVLEEGMKNSFPDHCNQMVESENLGLLDIVMCCMLGNYKAFEEVLGIKFIDIERTPLVFSWVKALIDLPVVKQTLPPHEKYVPFLKYFRQVAFKSSKA